MAGPSPRRNSEQTSGSTPPRPLDENVADPPQKPRRSRKPAGSMFPVGTAALKAAELEPPPEKCAREDRASNWAGKMLVEPYAAACVIINREFEILYYFGPTHDYLVQPIGAPTRDLLAMCREGLADKLRPLIKRAVEEARPATCIAEVRRGDSFFPVRCLIVPLKAPREAEGTLLVAFEDQAPTLDRQPPQEGDGDAGEPRLRQLEYELAVTREDLQSAVERLESSGEEYKAANQEVRSMNEELQSVNEELETSKEELQSLNEELTSVNQQLEGKVSELEATTNDLQNLLRSTDIAALFLDRTLRIKRFTPAVGSLLNLIPGDVGRPLSDIARKFTDNTLVRHAEAVLETLIPREAEVSTPDVEWYIRRVLPYRTEDDRIDGVVITFTDITARKRAEQELTAMARSLERQVEQRTRLVRLLQDVAVVSNEAQSVETAIETTLERVCLEFGWPAGHAFLLDEDKRQTLVDSGLWYLQSPEALAGLVDARREAQVQPGPPGAADQTAKSAQPVWTHDVQHDTASLRGFSINGSGIRAVFAFPILSGPQVAGVLEFFVTGEAAPDPDVIAGMREIGTQLGRVVERQQLEYEVADATAHEQRFVGQELHDTITQDIAGVRMLLAGLTEDLETAGSPLAARARASAEHLESTARRVRQLAHGMMPTEVAPDGLVGALETLAQSCRELHGMDTRIECAQPVSVASSMMAMHLYRIAQEAVHNAIRHAGAQHVSIVLHAADGECTLTVRDGGTGFDQDGSPPGVGMQIMRYRANMIGAKLDIQSQPGHGTEVICRFPCAVNS